MIRISTERIDPSAVLAEVASPAAGAVVLFLGTTRDNSDGRPTASLDYQSYNEMAEKVLSRLESEARGRWGLTGCAVVHRLGKLEIGETSVAVAVSAPHRDAAFEAGRWLIDTLKQSVPIWKRENWADGTGTWVHPGLAEKGSSGS